MRNRRKLWQRMGMVSIVGLTATLAMGCGSTLPTSDPSAPTSPTAELSRTITLGDIDHDEPAKKIKRLKPLADYLADHLKEFGIQQGRVVIARDIEEMARFLKDGTVDIYLDSPFPALVAQELSGSKVILRRWKQGQPTYWSTYIALRNNGIASVEDFVGKVIAFEEPHSTSGFVLPAGALIRRGFRLKEVRAPEASLAPDEIGYFFSLDEETTVELVLQGRVAGGAISNLDYDELPAEHKQEIAAFGDTFAVPRQLVSARSGLQRGLVDTVSELLTGLDQTTEGREILANLKKTKKFDRLPPDSEATLSELKALIALVTDR